MKKVLIFLLGMIVGASLLYIYCDIKGESVSSLSKLLNNAPSIDEVESMTKKGVEDLLSEDDDKNHYYKLDRYFLTEQTDLLTYTGNLKATYYWYGNSSKVYRRVTIKFSDNKFERYTISIKAQE